MRIDGVPWRQYLWICIKAVLFGAVFGVAGSGVIERLIALATL